MSFNAHSIEFAGTTRNGVRFRLIGTVSHRDGEYTNERNASKTITVSEQRAREIRDDLDEVLSDSDDGDFDDGGVIR